MICGLFAAGCGGASGAARCGSSEAVQVLGSGGPIPDDGRASSGYLVWVGGESRVLIDVGGGVFLRFGEASGSLEALSVIGVTHLHTDHVSDLPALLKGGYFAQRTRALRVAGPSDGEGFPGLRAHVEGLFHPERGLYRYLSGYLDGSGRLFPLEVREVSPSASEAVVVYEGEGLRVEAIGVHHGVVPALAYRVDVGERRVVFSGDLSGRNPAFVEFARGADVLIVDSAVPEDAGEVAASLHARPSEVGEMAAEAGVGRLVRSHWMARSLRSREADRAVIAARYGGPILDAEDGMCLRLSP